jgi:putative addiction module antidote
MEQTIIQIGNSYGVIIPKKILAQTGLKSGSKVIIQRDPNGKTILLSQNGKKYNSTITPDFLRSVDNINKKYGPTFKDLANR